MRFYIFVLLCFLLVVPVSAGIYVNSEDIIHQGDVVDLTGVYGWQCTVAWWANDMDSTPPDRTEDVCENSHNIEITPERFPVGNWYRWDGQVNRNENSLAFVVALARPAVLGNTTPTTPTVPKTTEPKPTITVTALPTTLEVIYVTSTRTPAPVRITTTTPTGFVFPNIPPIPVIIAMLLVLGVLFYWWVEGRI